ncbi:MAG: hypothetical protein OXC62_07660 [Aestuariivita sp.]|nr:hypothetical protein [Aestuariivita sp.]
MNDLIKERIAKEKDCTSETLLFLIYHIAAQCCLYFAILNDTMSENEISQFAETLGDYILE